MTITPDQVKTLLDKLKKDGYPGPFHFQPWGEQNQNGDYAESILFDANGETLVYGLPDAVGDLAAAAPEMRATIAAMTYEYRAQYYETVWGRWVTLCDWTDEDTARDHLKPDALRGVRTRLVRRPVGPVEVVEESDLRTNFSPTACGLEDR